MISIGVDIGTANAEVALCSRRRIDLVTVDGSSTSLVTFLSAKGGNLLVGQAAKRRAITNPESTLKSPTLLLGASEKDWPVDLSNRCATTAKPLPGSRAKISLGETPFDIEDLLEALGQRLLERAKESSAQPIQRCTVVRPAWFDEVESTRLESAVNKLGLPEVFLVEEATSTLMGLQVADEPARIVAIVDIGATASTIILASISNAGRKVLATGTERIGGDDVDNELVAVACQQLGISEVDPSTGELLRQACEELKKELSSQETAHRALPYLPSPSGNNEIVLSRRELSRACNELLIGFRSRAIATCREAAIDVRDITETHIVGAMSNVDTIAKNVQQLFKRKPRRSASPSGVAALGAAKIAAHDDLLARAAVQASYQRDAVIPPPPQQQQVVVSEPKPAPATTPIPEPSIPAARNIRSMTPPPQPRATVAPPSRASVAPGRPSVAAAAPIELTEGEIVNPTNVGELNALPFSRALTSDDLDPIALPILLLRMLGRPSVSGAVDLDFEGTLPLRIVVQQGRAVMTESEQKTLYKAIVSPHGRYSFSDGDFENRRGAPMSMLNLVSECLRVFLRQQTTESMRLAFGERLELGPFMSERRRRAVSRLGLTPAEMRMASSALDGERKFGEIIEHSGSGPRTALQLLTILELYNLLEWKKVETVVKNTLADELEERAKRTATMDHFEAISVHWAADENEIQEAYRRVLELTGEGGRWLLAAPEAAKIIRKRAREAIEVLADDDKRASYRAQTHGGRNYAAISDFLTQKAQAASMHDDKSRFDGAVSMLREVKATNSRLTPKPKPKVIDFDE